MKKMDVISLFDGISCLQEALNRANIEYSNYYASEIFAPAISITMNKYPKTIQLGDVKNIHFVKGGMQLVGESKLSIKIKGRKLLAGGSPCQDISTLNKGKGEKGLKGKKSSLFYKFLEAKESLNDDDYWLLENVRGIGNDIITKELKTRPIKLNSNWVTPQNRNRLYWTNIPVNSLPTKNNKNLSAVLESNVNEKYYQSEGWNIWWLANKEFQLNKGYSTLNARVAACLTARQYASWNGNFIQDQKGIRRLTPIECERLQTLPDNYTAGIKDTDRYKVLGDCWTVNIVAHILKHMAQYPK